MRKVKNGVNMSVAVLALLLCAGLASAAMVNLDFNGMNPEDPPAYTYAGPGIDGGTTWNGIDASTGHDVTFSGTDLLDSLGNATSAAFSVTHVGGNMENAYHATYQASGPTDFFALASDLIYNGSGNGIPAPSAFYFTGLDTVDSAATMARAYFYGSPAWVAASGASLGFADAEWSTYVGIGAAMAVLAEDQSILPGVETDANVAVFVTDWMPVVDGNIEGTLSLAPGVFATMVNGMSLEVIPEPATMTLLGVGALGMLCRRKK